MGPLGGALLSGGLGLGKAIIGGIQSIRGNRQMNRLMANRPKYNIPQGYMDAYNTYKRLAGSEIPGYNLMQGQIGQSTAKAMTSAERGAMSSNQFMDAALGAQDKELEALRNLGIMSQQWQSQQQQNLAQAQNQMGALQDQKWDYNVNQPWQTKMNMANDQRQAGAQNLFGGMGDMASSIMSFAGTSNFMDIYKKMFPQANTTVPNTVAPPVGTSFDRYNGLKGL